MAEEVSMSQMHLSRREWIAEDRLVIWGVPVGTLHSPASSIIAILKHIFVLWIKRPKVSLPLAATFPRDLDEALVKGKIMSDGVLPALLVLLKVRELGGDVRIDFA